jgi:hypothetical protein
VVRNTAIYDPSRRQATRYLLNCLNIIIIL